MSIASRPGGAASAEIRAPFASHAARVFARRVRWLTAILVVLACGDSATQASPGAALAVLLDDAVLQLVSGDGQEGTVGETLPMPLVVVIEDSHGNPFARVPVVWTARDSVSSVTTLTDGDGQAFIAWQLGATAGEQYVDVQIAGVQAEADRSTTLRAKARPAKPHRILTSHASLDLDVGEGVVVTATVVDRFGNVIPDAVIEWRSDNPAVASVQAMP
jgi:hypothetical protein